MERLLIAALLTIGLGAAAPEVPESDPDPAVPTESAPEGEATILSDEDFGEGLTLKRMSEFKDVVSHPENYAG